MDKLERGAREGGGLLVRKEQKGQSGDRCRMQKARGWLRGGRKCCGFYRRPKWDKIRIYGFIANSVCDKGSVFRFYGNPKWHKIVRLEFYVFSGVIKISVTICVNNPW